MALACITGASAGIGREFAKQLSARGYDLILVARNREKMEAVARECNTAAEIVECDLSERSECERLVRLLSSRHLHLFINNAGFGAVGVFESCDLNRDMEMIDVNVRAVHILTHGVLAQMKARGRGYILNTASVAGLMPGGPLMATYYATKAYVVSLTNAIAAELEKEASGVHISVLCPGPVNTEFNDVAGVSFALPGISARKCVKEALRGMARHRTVIIPSVSVRVYALLAKLAPRSVTLSVLKNAQSKKTGA